MDINETAPVVARDETEISATPEIIWQLMTDIKHWPDWNHNVELASLEGELTEGGKFRWKSGPASITSTLQQLEKHRRLVWTGKTLGINAIHVWKLESERNLTVVKTEESWEGIIPKIFTGSMQKMLESSLKSGLKYLREEAEGISASN